MAHKVIHIKNGKVAQVKENAYPVRADILEW
jgi:hypothetical protein